jgi:hypothetical protein
MEGGAAHLVTVPSCLLAAAAVVVVAVVVVMETVGVFVVVPMFSVNS